MIKQLTRQSITLALTLLFALCFSGLFAMPAAAEEAEYANWAAAAAAAQPSEGETLNDYTLDTSGKTLAIHTARGFAYFAQQVTSGNNAYAKYTVTLMKDIDLRDASVAGYDAANIAAAPTDGTGINNSWVPIGKDSSIYFKGNFDGKGHTISGVYINNSANQYLGLFGYADMWMDFGKIENLGVIDSSITSTDTTRQNRVGGVAGSTAGAALTNCYFDGTVTIQKGYAGGVVGYISNSSGSLINCYNKGEIKCIGNTVQLTGIGGVAGYTTSALTNCYNTGDVTATIGNTGGVVGYAGGNAILTNCYNTGAVHNDNATVGGIVGESTSCTITNCYNTASVTSESGYVGGVVGALGSSTLKNSYNIGTIISHFVDDKSAGSIIGYCNTSIVSGCYYLGGTAELGGMGAATALYGTAPIELSAYTMTGTVDRNQMVALANAKTDEDVAVWAFTADSGITAYYPVLAANKQDPAPSYTLEAITSWPIAGERALQGDATKHKDYTISDGGNTYTIYTAKGLAWFANQVNGGNNFKGKTIKLGDNINLNDNTVEGYTKGGTINWVPIGTSSAPFAGIFDGDNKTISSVYIKDDSTNHLGLFGYVTGNIQNLGVIDSSIESTFATASVGGIVGYLYHGRYSAPTPQITNCYYSGTICGTGGNTGGIVGANNQNTKILNCYNMGDVTFTGDGNVGGISGSNGGEIKCCYNTGTITIPTGNSVNGGGIVGHSFDSCSIENCYNTGDVIATNTGNIGGIVGRLSSTCQYSYNIGKVTAAVDANAGGVVGAFINDEPTASIVQCFYNNELSGTTKGIGYIEKTLGNDPTTGYTTAQMTGMSYDEEFPDIKTNQMNFEQNVMDWTYHDNAFTDTEHTYYYPTLKTNVQTPAPSTVKTVPTITVSLANWVYGTTANTPTATTNSTSTAITYQYCETINGTYTDSHSFTEEGTYYVKALIAGNQEFTPAESEPVAFKITPATITDTTQTAQNAVYNGKAITIAAANGTTVNGQTLTVTYGEGDTASAIIPSFTEAGDHTVSYTLSAPSHDDVNGSITFTIEKADSNVTSDDADQTVTYGNTLTLTATAAIAPVPTVPDGGTDTSNTASDPTAAVTNATTMESGAGDITNTANGTDDTTDTTDATNATDDGVSTPTVSATANKFVFTATPAAGGAEVTLGEVDEVAGTNNTATASFDYNTTDKKITPGDYTIKVYYGGGDNLKPVDGETITLTLKPKEITATTTAAVTKQYDGTNTLADVALEVKAQHLANPSDVVTVTATATYPDATVGSGKAISFINLVQGGAESAYYTAIPSTNVLGEITAKALSDDMIAEIANQVYTGSDIAPTVTVTNGTLTLTLGTDYTVTYENDCKNVTFLSGVGDTALPTVTITAVANGNYSGTASKTFAINPAPLVVKVNDMRVYNGSAEPTYTYTVTGAKDDLATALTTMPTLTCDVVPDANGKLTTNGSYTITVTGAVASSNYTLTMENGTLTVASRPAVSVTPVVTPTPVPEVTPTPTPTAKPGAAATAKPEATATLVPTATPSASEVPTVSTAPDEVAPTVTPTPTPVPEETVPPLEIEDGNANVPAMLIGLIAILVALGSIIFIVLKKRNENAED